MTEEKTASGVIRVLIIDDSQLVHTLLGKVFSEQDGLIVAGDAYNGRNGVQMARDLAPDVIIMDINMPAMNGLEAIEEIMAEKPSPIIVFSSASREVVDLGFKAIERGAVDLVEKPAAPTLSELKEIIEQRLIRTIRTFADFKVMRRFKKRVLPTLPHGMKIPQEAPRPDASPATARTPSVRPCPPRADLTGTEFPVVAVASSTGGPQMLHLLLSSPALAGLPAAVIVLQHLAEGFIDGFAEWLSVFSVLPVSIAREGGSPEPGCVQVAPAGRHLGIDGQSRFAVVDKPPLFGIRPSADVLFDSLARQLGSRLVAVVLSGMGSDGSRALPLVKERGGYVIAQNEESSLIYGMPKAAIETGRVDAVLAINDIPPYLARYLRGEVNGHAR